MSCKQPRHATFSMPLCSQLAGHVEIRPKLSLPHGDWVCSARTVVLCEDGDDHLRVALWPQRPAF